MRRIELSSYLLENGESYDVKAVLAAMLFNPALKLSARQVIAQEPLATKIENATGHILLEEEEYQRIIRAVDSFVGFGRGDLQFLERVMNALEVPVIQKPEE